MAKSIFVNVESDENEPLMQTGGNFQINGIVRGVGREQFLKTGKGKSEYRILNFGLEVELGKTLYVNMFGAVQDYAYFYDTEKNESVKVEWAKRKSFSRENCRINGVGVGLVQDENGKNVVEYMTDYDAIGYVADHLEDGMSVYVRGDLSFEHYKTDDGQVHYNQKLNVKRIFLKKQDIDLTVELTEDDDPPAMFEQDIIYLSIEKDTEENFAWLNTQVVTYNSIEPMNFRIYDSKLASAMRKGLKAYDKIHVSGVIATVSNSDTVEEDSGGDDVWGKKNPMERTRSSYQRVFVVTGAQPKTIVSGLYTEKNIGSAIQKMNRDENAVEEFADDDEDWGTNHSSDEDDEDLNWD